MSMPNYAEVAECGTSSTTKLEWGFRRVNQALYAHSRFMNMLHQSAVTDSSDHFAGEVQRLYELRIRDFARIVEAKSQYAALTALRTVKADWNGYGAPAPGEIAFAIATSMIEAFQDAGLEPSVIGPSPEGGLTMTFLRNSKRVAVEFHNDGEAVAVISRPGGVPTVWEFDPNPLVEECQSTIATIAAHLRD